MKLRRTVIALGMGLGALSLSLGYAGDAQACGGCFVQQSENTQVTSHRMILSVSQDATSLWDQIVYSGEPQSFAWILPVVGVADVKLSSDALFRVLDEMTSVQVFSPQINCPTGSCGPSSANDGSQGTGTGGGGEVTVVAQETVGPYETVQLSSQDPNALKTWLLSHGYSVPPDVSPIIDAYVAGGFNFLALKLVPGQGVDAMRPVRITTPGASPVLPLRMVAAGTGAVTPITLWIMGEGRYETTNFPSFTIQSSELVWDWTEQRSNYTALRDAGFKSSDGRAWLVEAAEQLSVYGLKYTLMDLAQYDPKASGYADEDGQGAVEAATADIEALFSTIPESSLWVTRIYGELSRGALGTDLEIGASMNQAYVDRFLQAEASVGVPPPCPPPPDCGENPGSGGGVFGGIFGSGSGPDLKPGSCAMDGRPGAPFALGGAVALAALALSRRRRSR